MKFAGGHRLPHSEVGLGCATGIENVTPTCCCIGGLGQSPEGLTDPGPGGAGLHWPWLASVAMLLTCACSWQPGSTCALNLTYTATFPSAMSLCSALNAICCHGGPPSPQVKSVVMIRSALAAAATQAHHNTTICLPFSFVIVACHAAKLA